MAAGSRSLRQPAGRSSRPRISYREDSTSCESDPDDDLTDYFPSAKSRPQSTHTSRQPGRGTRSNDLLRTKRKAASTTFTHPPTKRPRKVAEGQKSRDGKKGAGAIEGGTIPPWHTLPYHILLQIFEYAAQPASQNNVRSQSSIQWLLATARICKAFAEPAISALYYKPPLEPPSRARAFVAHLQCQNQCSSFNYRAKVKYLDVPVSILNRKFQGQAPLKIEDLLEVTPQLRGLDIIRLKTRYSYIDPFSGPVNLKAVQVLQETLHALTDRKLRLQEWKWDAVAASWPKDFDLQKIHRTALFETLRRLTITCWHTKARNLHESKTSYENFGKAISALPNLTELRLVRFLDINSESLPFFPRGLQELEIDDCLIESKTLQPFLASHGHSMRRLVLDHNRFLNLSFLVDLASSCPALEVLTMDLIYHSTHVTFSDTDPGYEKLLPYGQLPTWPATLRWLELNHLRQWDSNDADNFFTSLIDSAKDLPNLRQLMIKASLNESNWRERISFRDRWTTRFDKVFLRKSEPPNPHLRSIAAFKAEKSRQAKGIPPKNKIPHRPRKVMVLMTCSNHTVPDEPLSRPKRSLRNNNSQLKDVIHDSSADSDNPYIHTRRRSSRFTHNDSDPYTSPSQPRPHRHRRRRPKGNSEDSSSEDSALDDPFSPPDASNSESPTSHEAEVDEGASVIQGMCDIVRIAIDNLRPMEEQLDEDDFMDEEASGDEDWNGDDVREDEDVVAW